MEVWLPVLIVALVLVMMGKSEHEHKRKGDLGFVIMILIAALLLSGAAY
jgi:hypothetical protein